MSQSPLILVVDDSREISKVIKVHLEADGYRVIIASSALECVRVARKERPALIILDIMMPGMDGATAAGVMHEEKELKAIPVVFLSALPEDEIQEKVRETGVAGYVAKPFRKQDLLEVVGRCVKSGKLDKFDSSGS